MTITILAHSAYFMFGAKGAEEKLLAYSEARESYHLPP